jgi:hypothetical protein
VGLRGSGCSWRRNRLRGGVAELHQVACNGPRYASYGATGGAFYLVGDANMTGANAVC